MRSLFFIKRTAFWDEFNLFWKIVCFGDACSGIFAKILNPVLEVLPRHVPDQRNMECPPHHGGGGEGGGDKALF